MSFKVTGEGPLVLQILGTAEGSVSVTFSSGKLNPERPHVVLLTPSQRLTVPPKAQSSAGSLSVGW